MADNVERPPDQFDFGSESTPGSDFGLTQGSLPNGARTPTRGPCRCGYKHWFDGIEYDYVFSFVEGKSMGFNDNDNPQTAAGLYVLKYKLGGFNNTQIISQIAARIREALHEHRGGTAFTSPDHENPAEKKLTFDPEKADIFRPTMNTTNMKDGKMVKTIYPGGQWDETIKGLEAGTPPKAEAVAHQDQAARALQNEKREKEEIKKRMEMAEAERQQEAALNRLRTSKQQKPLTSSSKSDDLVPYVDGGSVRMVKRSELAQLKGQPDIVDQIIEDDDEYPYPTPDMKPEEITNQHVMGKLKRDGKKKTSEWLQSLGTDEAQAEEYIMVSKTIDAQMKMIRHAASVSGEDGGNPMAALMAAAAGKKRKTDHQAQPKAVDPWGGHAVSLSSLQPAEEAIETDTSKPLGPEPKEDYKLDLDPSKPSIKLRITLRNKPLCDVQINLTHTLEQLYNHIRTCTSVKNFNIFNPIQGNRKLDAWGSTMSEVGLTAPTKLNLEEI